MTGSAVAWLALWLPMAGPVPAPESERFDAVTRTGQALKLTEVVKARGLAVDTSPIEAQVVLEEPDGTITPLLSDEASRALFLDERMRHRPIEVHGRFHMGLPYLQVVTFRVREQGEWRIPEYFCEVCTISVRYPQICPCCQGPMVLRMKP
jgi:hypothetical protein